MTGSKYLELAPSLTGYLAKKQSTFALFFKSMVPVPSWGIVRQDSGLLHMYKWDICQCVCANGQMFCGIASRMSLLISAVMVLTSQYARVCLQEKYHAKT